MNILDSTTVETMYNDDKLLINHNGALRQVETDKLLYVDDSFIKAVNHRGYNSVAPENTLQAFALSKMYGFRYVECDVSFTSDSYPVIIHDATVDRTSDGSGAVGSFTLTDIRKLDFGSWKSSEYAGTKIPTFQEFLRLCKDLSLYPYVEIKSSETYTKSQLYSLVDIAKKFDMLDNITWISFNIDYLNYIGNYYTEARIGYLQTPTATNIAYVKSLREVGCEVFYDMNYENLTKDIVNTLVSNEIPLEVWTVDDEDTVKSLNKYVSGFTTNTLNVAKVLNKPWIDGTFSYDDISDYDPTKTLMYYWDFTSSTTDSISGKEATLTGCSISDEGLSITAGTQNCVLGTDVFGIGYTMEIEIASMSKGFGTSVHGRAFMIYDPSLNKTEGFVYRKTNNVWGYYVNSAWDTDSDITDADAFSGKTLKIYNDGGYLKLYVDDTLVYTTTKQSSSTRTAVALGSYADSFYSMVIKSVKIYKNV